MRKINLSILCLLAIGILLINSCSKGGGDPAPSDPCDGVTINVNGTTTNATSAVATDGSITATASGGTGFTYSISGTFQSSGTFNNLAAGNYTVTAKSNDGCIGTRAFTIIANPGACAGIVIVAAATTSNVTPCIGAPNGGINASATGSTGFTFSINGTTFQASGNFTNLAAGNYTVTAKDVNGCIGTTAVTISNAAAGPFFSAVKTLLENNCVSCHNNTIANGGMNWTVDCNIVINKDRVKARAVDNQPSSMPPTGPLSQTDKDKITAWINAGGRYTD